MRFGYVAANGSDVRADSQPVFTYSGKDFGEQAYREPGADFDQNVAQLLIGQHRFK
jgi:hypothetical protein